MSEELEPRPAPPTAEDIRYYGQVFGLFLLASVAERLFIIDQHAAHERILFERFRASPRKPQHLLVPIAFEATNDEERNLENNIDFCSTLGIEMRRSSPGNWEIHSLPEGFQPLEAEVVSFVKQAKGTRRELEQELYARMSCRAAVKEGDSIDEISATELIRQAFALSQARCPHGRPIWYELSRRELYHLVGRL
jgi:DNA mismatch repair protein MutL